MRSMVLASGMTVSKIVYYRILGIFCLCSARINNQEGWRSVGESEPEGDHDTIHLY